MTTFRFKLVVLLLFLAYGIAAQDVVALRMMFDHDPAQWEMYAEDETADGQLKTFDHIDARKIFWNYELYGNSGRIWNLFPAQYDNWKLRSDTLTVSIQTVFRGRWAEWRISDGNITLSLRAQHLSNPFYWMIDHPDFGRWEMYTYYDQDPRDWKIQDTLSDKVPLEMKIAASFIVIAVNFILL